MQIDPPDGSTPNQDGDCITSVYDGSAYYAYLTVNLDEWSAGVWSNRLQSISRSCWYSHYHLSRCENEAILP